MPDIPEELQMFELGGTVEERIEPFREPPPYAAPTDVKAVEAARILAVHPNTIKRMLKMGMFSGAYRIGTRGDWRVPIESLEAFKARGGTFYR